MVLVSFFRVLLFFGGGRTAGGLVGQFSSLSIILVAKNEKVTQKLKIFFGSLWIRLIVRCLLLNFFSVTKVRGWRRQDCRWGARETGGGDNGWFRG